MPLKKGSLRANTTMAVAASRLWSLDRELNCDITLFLCATGYGWRALGPPPRQDDKEGGTFHTHGVIGSRPPTLCYKRQVGRVRMVDTSMHVSVGTFPQKAQAGKEHSARPNIDPHVLRKQQPKSSRSRSVPSTGLSVEMGRPCRTCNGKWDCVAWFGPCARHAACIMQ